MVFITAGKIFRYLGTDSISKSTIELKIQSWKAVEIDGAYFILFDLKNLHITMKKWRDVQVIT